MTSGDERLGGFGLAVERHAGEPELQRVPVDARDHADREQRLAEERAAHRGAIGRDELATLEPADILASRVFDLARPFT